MEYGEDAFWLHKVLPDVDPQDIATYLRTQIPVSEWENRCQIALIHFLALEKCNKRDKDFSDDVACLQYIFKSTSLVKIKNVLKLLSPIPNRKQIVVRLLLNKKRKAPVGQDVVEGPSTSKQRKIEPNDTAKLKAVKDKPQSTKVCYPPVFEVLPCTSQTLPAQVNFLANNAALDSNQGEAPINHVNLSNDEEHLEDEARAVIIPTNEEHLQDEARANPVGDLVEILDLDPDDFDPEPILNESPDSTVTVPDLPVDEKLFLKLIEMFPEASSQYIRSVCAGKKWSPAIFSEIVDEILMTDDYPKRPAKVPSPIHQNPEDQLKTLKELFPDADPTYLESKLQEYEGNDEALGQFIENTLVTRKYPTLKEYLRRQQLSAQQRQYTTEFNVERFIEIFPDPQSVFEDPNRKSAISDAGDLHYVKCVMRNTFNQLYVRDVDRIVTKSSNIFSIVKELQKCLSRGCVKKSKGTNTPIQLNSQNIPLLQELAYFQHKEVIIQHLQDKKRKELQDRQEAKELGLLHTCNCCFDEEIMPLDIVTCAGGCRFCKDCVKRSAEVAFGEGKTNFPCFEQECDAEFTLQVLQCVLPPKLFSKLAQKKAMAEVKAAGLDDLEVCPFCDFANIPAPEDKLFRCLNPDCMKESCRQCKEPSHVPLRCEEVEKDQAVKARTYIENKMTEALVRECWKCHAKFIKEEGCNKMTCSCGAMMCYICRKPVTDYKHFNGQGGQRFDLCPLYTDNFIVNENQVLKAAKEAKKEVNADELVNDPTSNLEEYFGARRNNNYVQGPRHNLGLPIEHHIRGPHHHIRIQMENRDGQIRYVNIMPRM